MSFEEDFKSLNNKEYMVNFIGNPADPFEEQLYTETVISSFCLDKERVRKAINKCVKELYEFSDGGSIKGIDKADLWSELEL
jgi:hypothetical protein